MRRLQRRRWRSDWDSKDIAFALVAAHRAPTPTRSSAAEEQALADFPTAKPQTIDDFKEEQNKQVDRSSA